MIGLYLNQISYVLGILVGHRTKNGDEFSKTINCVCNIIIKKNAKAVHTNLQRTTFSVQLQSLEIKTLFRHKAKIILPSTIYRKS